MSTLAQIASTCNRLGVEMPKPLADAQADADGFLARVPAGLSRTFRAGDRRPSAPRGVVAAGLAALEDGRDPFDDPRVLREVVAERLLDLNLAHAARLRADAQLGDAVRRNADTVLGLWAKALEPHAAALAEAARLGVTDLHEARTLRGQQLSAWGQAAEAAEVFAVVRANTNLLWGECGIPKPDPLLVLANATGAQLQPARNMVTRDDRVSAAWALALSGIAVEHIKTLADLRRRERLDDGVVEPLGDPEQHRTARPRATVST